MYETLSVSPKQPGETLSAYAYRVLYDNIMHLNLLPGSPINEAELAGLLGASRTPVHEAITQLKEVGLVDIFPRKESRVSKINLMQVSEGIFVRSHVEAQIIPLAVGRVPEPVLAEMRECLDQQQRMLQQNSEQNAFYIYDRSFHDLLYKAVNMQNVCELVRKSSIQGLRISHLVYFDRTYFSAIENKSYAEHRQIFDLVTGKIPLDFNLTDFLYNHIIRFQSYLEPYIERYREFFSFTGTDVG